MKTHKNTFRRSGNQLSWVVLIILVAVPLTVGFVGSQGSREAIDGWYATADKAPWTPPNSIFGPMWTVLYILMGVASWLLWRQRHQEFAKLALVFYVIQLAFNAAWTFLFFQGYAQFGSFMLWVSMADIVLLIISLILCLRYAHRVSRTATWMLVPLLAWVTYAASLNLYIAITNAS